MSSDSHLRCSRCEGYLSCSPIRVLPDGRCICGHCSPSSNDMPAYRVPAFEAVLRRTSFACRFKQHGCVEQLAFGQVDEHESKCTYRTFPCPLYCAWEGLAPQMIEHFSNKHPEFINQKAEFSLCVIESAQGIFMIVVDTVAFIVNYVYDASRNNLKYDLRYCDSKILQGVSCKARFINGSDVECNINLKTNKCVLYDDSFNSMHNAVVLNLSKFLHSLDFPSRIVVAFDLIVTRNTKLDDNLNVLRCSICHNYLIPPLFNLDNDVICSNCADSNPKCEQSNDSTLLRLVNKASYPCRWRDCKAITSSSSFRMHDSMCQFRLYRCLFAPACQDNFKMVATIAHFQKHRAEYSPNGIVYKTIFSQPYGNKHVFTIKDNEVVLVQHSVVSADSCHKNFVTLYSTNSGKVTGSIDFEHQHCRLKSKPFALVGRCKLVVTLSQLPPCFQSNDELRVAVIAQF